MDFLVSFFKQFWTLILEHINWTLDALAKVLSFFVFTLLDGFFTVIHAFISLIDFSAIAFNFGAQYANLPPTLIWLVNQTAIPQGLTYIGLAVTIRLTLNLIPAAFTRI